MNYMNNIFTPIMKTLEKSSKKSSDNRLNNLIVELTEGLSATVRTGNVKMGTKDELSYEGILTPKDEFNYWNDVKSITTITIEKERAEYFCSC